MMYTSQSPIYLRYVYLVVYIMSINIINTSERQRNKQNKVPVKFKMNHVKLCITLICLWISNKSHKKERKKERTRKKSLRKVTWNKKNTGKFGTILIQNNQNEELESGNPKTVRGNFVLFVFCCCIEQNYYQHQSQTGSVSTHLRVVDRCQHKL